MSESLSEVRGLGASVARRFRVTHRTEYRYSDIVTSSYGRGFLTPRDSQRQRCVAHRLDIDPVPSDSSTSIDAYGNISSYFHLTEPHRALTITSDSIVDVYPAPPERYAQRAGTGTVGGGAAGRAQGSACGRLHPGPESAGDHRRSARVRGAQLRARAPADRGAAGSHDADPHRLHLPVGVDDDFHRGQRGSGGPGRGMPGLRQAGDRLPARQRSGRQLRVRLSRHRPATRKGSDDRHRRDPRLGRGMDSATAWPIRVAGA